MSQELTLISDNTFAAITAAAGPIPDDPEEWPKWKEKADFALEVLEVGSQEMLRSATDAAAEAAELKDFLATFDNPGPEDKRAIHSGVMLGVARYRGGLLVVGLSNRYGSVEDWEEARDIWRENYMNREARNRPDKKKGTPGGILHDSGIEQFFTEGLETRWGQRVVGAAQKLVGQHVSVYKVIKKVTAADNEKIDIRVAMHIQKHDIDVEDVYRSEMLDQATQEAPTENQSAESLELAAEESEEEDWGSVFGTSNGSSLDTEALARITDAQSLAVEAATLGKGEAALVEAMKELKFDRDDLAKEDVCRAIYKHVATAAA